MHPSFVYSVLLIFSEILDGSVVQARILVDRLSNIGHFSYIVSIMDSSAHICGGSIIAARTILTAGHCTYGRIAKNISIRAGSNSRTHGGTVVQAERHMTHPKFQKRDLTFDIALVYLNEALPVYSSRHIRVIPIYTKRLPSERTVVAAGWGTIYEGGKLVDTLRSTSFKTVPWRHCRRIFEGELTRSMFCAGSMNGSRDTCQGDSGGPLVMGRWQVGITSHGKGCGRKGYPGIYTSVPLLSGWVHRFAKT